MDTKNKILNLLIFILIINMHEASGLDFNFTSPDSTELNEPFNIDIESNSSDNFDVKIFVHNSEDNKISAKEVISKVKNSDGEWKNSWNYLISSFPEKKFYQLIIENYSENSKLCIRLRKTGSTSFSEQCTEITINFPNEENIKKNETAYENSSVTVKLNKSNNVLMSKEEKFRLSLVYFFSFITLVIVFLLGLRKL